MTPAMTPELYWMTLTIIVTAFLWAPHIVQRILEMGPHAAFRDPRHDVPTKAPWAQRAIRAHTNAVENLVVFGLLAVAVHIQDAGTELTSRAAAIYFFARIAHYAIYLLALPWLRTPVFLVGLGCQMVLAGAALSAG